MKVYWFRGCRYYRQEWDGSRGTADLVAEKTDGRTWNSDAVQDFEGGGAYEYNGSVPGRRYSVRQRNGETILVLGSTAGDFKSGHKAAQRARSRKQILVKLSALP
ncbi:hypothetical protein DPMN_035531 [Dreissena polymorpha]|uniref:Uncharacterized protein n=1 Tax=Dreissena polymorpha TaxID=45954 RepID=A0A9D4M9U7_DREPO|nr:hypothetical protein DPMN_035531 [Dreissena polymorpha]